MPLEALILPRISSYIATRWLLKFERLMHLNALIIKYPGLEWLQQIFKTIFGCSGSVEVTHHRNRATIALIGEVI